MPRRVDNSLQLEILMSRLTAQWLADALPACEKRLEMYNTVLACDIMLKNLKSGTATYERVIEVRQAYEEWKRSKAQGPLAHRT
jgi:hypothetical protein